MSTDPSKGIPLKDGSFTFPTTLKCRVDRKALKAIPRNFEICKQGIEALNDLFYEAPPEKKEGVLVQKSIWENVQERVQDIQIFNAGANYTDLSNQILPIRVNLPKGNQSYPIDQILTKDLSNPYLEMKKFARELLDIVSAIRCIREEKLFKYEDFHIYPTKEAFVLTDSESGERNLTVAIHSICPDSIVEGTSSEELCLMAIKDLIRQRWDANMFGRVLKANDLTTMFLGLRHLSRDVPTVERIAMGAAYTALYAFIAFLVFSVLMFLSGLTPWNNAELQKISYKFHDSEGKKEQVVSKLIRNKDNRKKFDEISSYRVSIGTNEESLEKIEVVGTYLSPLRLEKMNGLFIFDKLSLSSPLDRVYGLDYETPISLEKLKYNDLKIIKAASKEMEQGGKKTRSSFIVKSQKKWGRERFNMAPSNKKETTLPLEVLIVKKGWTLSSQPSRITFKQTSSKKAAGVNEELRVFANPPKGSKARTTEINKRAFYRVTFKNEDLSKVPIEIQYLKSPKGPVVATVNFSETYYGGGLPKTHSIKVKKKNKRRRNEDDENDEDDEDNEDEFDDEDDEDDDRRSRGRLKRKDPDVFELAGKKYYRLAQLPDFTTIKVANKQLPSDDIECTLHIAVPGIETITEIPITFNPKEEILFKKPEMLHVRSQVSGLAYPVELQKRLWNKKPRKLEGVRIADFTFVLDDGGSKQPMDNYGALGIGFQIQGDRTLYFYNTKDGKTNSIQNYSVKDGVLYFGANEKNYKLEASSVFKPVAGNLNAFTIRRQTAESITQLYVAVLTDKNVENAKLTLKKNKRTELELPISARSEEALKVVAWRKLAVNQSYKKEDWINKDDPKKQKAININGPLGGLRYNVILFAGDEAVADVSNKAYLKIENSSVLNMIYQTVDSDWFSRTQSETNGIKSLNAPAVQLKFLKRSKDKRPPYTLLDHKEIGSVATKELYFLADQSVIGQVYKYYAVAGNGVKAGEKDKKTKLTFYLPEKDMEASIDIIVARKEENKTKWNVTFNEEDKSFNIAVANYKTANAHTLAKEIRFMLTCAATQLIHRGYHKGDNKVHRDDNRWAQTIAWALKSIGSENPTSPSTQVLGKLAEQLSEYLRKKDEVGIKLAYKLMRETLLLSWSGKSEDLLNNFLELTQLEENIEKGKNIDNDFYKLNVEFYSKREFPILVDSPTRFKSVSFNISFDKLLLDKTAIQLHELNESYYRGIPTNFDSVPHVKSYLANLYPKADAFPTQLDQRNLKEVGINIQISDKLSQNLLQYSLWEERLKNSVKPTNKFWVAFQGATDAFTDVDGKIDTKQVDNIATELQKSIESQLISPIQMRRVYWQELQDKVRLPEERDKNRDNLSKQEKKGLLKFIDRSTMPQFTGKKAWYTSFEFVVDRLTLDACPYGRQWVYIETYRPQADGLPGEKHKLNLFKRNGMTLDPYPSKNYNVEILKYGDTWGGATETKLVRVTGIDAFLGFYQDHTSSEIKGGPDKRIRLDIFYDKKNGKKNIKITPTSGISPAVIDFDVHPKSVILFEISGYQVSPDRIREIMRNKGLEMSIKRGTKNWQWKFSVDNGPVISPYAFNVQATEIVENQLAVELSWKEEPTPGEEQRNFTSLQDRYDIEFFYLDSKEKLPEEFSPYNNYASICEAYNNNAIPARRMYDLLEKLYDSNAQLQQGEKFEWTEELANTYDKKLVLQNNNLQMFQYKYDEAHVITLNAYENIYTSEEFKGKHPQLKAPAISHRDENINKTLVWKISPKEGKSLRGFPKYVLDKDLVSRKQIIDNE